MAENGQLFNSTTDPVPAVRRELDIIPVEDNGKSYLYFHDMLGYATRNFALESHAGAILSLIDGRKSVEELSPYMGGNVTTGKLLEFIRFLDGHRLISSRYFRAHAEAVEQEYESSEVHRPVTAGNSYPSDPEKLRELLDGTFSTLDTGEESVQGVKALYAPHIDPRVGMESYVKAFSTIRNLKPKRVVILATSHYSGLYPDRYDNAPFIVSNKDFEMPLGTIPCDRDAVEKLGRKAGELGVTTSDRAHRIEHSIELHLLFLNYLWDHEFTVVPILVRGFDELFYMEDGYLGEQIQAFGEYLGGTFGRDEKTFFLISGDLAHVGKKFGDPDPASSLLDEVKAFDRQFLDCSEAGEADALLALMKGVDASGYDPYRICGFAPLYLFLKSLPGAGGSVLTYDLWDETERESAVTFGSILYSG